MPDMFFFKSVIAFIRDPQYRNLLITSTIILCIGTLVYHHLEGWSYVDSLYFSVITLTTIGFGDFAPQTDAGKLFTIGYIILGLGMILSFINAVYEHYRDERNGRRSDKTPNKSIS